MKIVILDGHTLNPGDLSWNAVEALGETTVHAHTPLEDIIKRSIDADILFTNKTPLNKETLASLPRLKYVGVLATGYNVVDIEFAKTRGIPVCNVPNYGTSSVAQAVFALLLELCHHVQAHDNAVKKGDWSQSKHFCFWNFPLVELADKTIGIVGFGRIGQCVADIALAFGMSVIAFDSHKTDQSLRKNFKWAELDELLRESDVVSLHCPLFQNNTGMINRRSLALMKKSAFLINTSRGPLIQDADLAEALNTQVIAGAALDVLSVEPPPMSNPLIAARNCIITPHISWATLEARSRLMKIAGDNLKVWLEGKPSNVVNL